ncbi:beach-domain-containing protein, partial [Ramicandelaber brevisporus]
MVILLECVPGRLDVTSTQLFFIPASRDTPTATSTTSSAEFDSLSVSDAAERSSSDQEVRLLLLDYEAYRERSWSLSELREIHLRQFRLRKSALELFFADHTNFFFHFPVARDRFRLYVKLTSLGSGGGGLLYADIRSPVELLKRSRLTERWQRGELSNFDYLMALNTIAGRSYNDLSQYPVFPWILVDYDSEVLDLTNPATFRDLSKPVGALNPNRLEQIIERYESFEDPSGQVPKFHYGTHYSSAAIVAYYMIRLEPFTSVHIALQSGRFDHADRQFHSIGDTWRSCLRNSGDVKELTPEFFYLPDFLRNFSGFDLGRKQSGEPLGDIILPPWANGSPEQFVFKHRQALESDYVSRNLHKWIDLIFGYKQTGPEAVKAHNVFYYLTYESAVDVVDKIKDPAERASVESQIYHFGQTPTQLFRKPHPQR